MSVIDLAMPALVMTSVICAVAWYLWIWVPKLIESHFELQRSMVKAIERNAAEHDEIFSLLEKLKAIPNRRPLASPKPLDPPRDYYYPKYF